MIIRSGLIRNRDGVDFDGFTDHWRNGHAPLVVKIDGLRAYSQNHVLERLSSDESSGLHRIDGMSQLYFDDVESMNISMASPEQEACIVDLRGFLSDVTLLIQQAGDFHQFGNGADLCVKLLYLLHGEAASAEALAESIRTLMSQRGRSWKYRVNPIIARDIVVDQSISAGKQVIDIVMEIWTENDTDADLVKSLVEASDGLDVIGGFVVEEFLVLPL